MIMQISENPLKKLPHTSLKECNLKRWDNAFNPISQIAGCGECPCASLTWTSSSCCCSGWGRSEQQRSRRVSAAHSSSNPEEGFLSFLNQVQVQGLQRHKLEPLSLPNLKQTVIDQVLETASAREGGASSSRRETLQNTGSKEIVLGNE